MLRGRHLRNRHRVQRRNVHRVRRDGTTVLCDEHVHWRTLVLRGRVSHGVRWRRRAVLHRIDVRVGTDVLGNPRNVHGCLWHARTAMLRRLDVQRGIRVRRGNVSNVWVHGRTVLCRFDVHWNTRVHGQLVRTAVRRLGRTLLCGNVLQQRIPVLGRHVHSLRHRRRAVLRGLGVWSVAHVRVGNVSPAMRWRRRTMLYGHELQSRSRVHEWQLPTVYRMHAGPRRLDQLRHVRNAVAHVRRDVPLGRIRHVRRNGHLHCRADRSRIVRQLRDALANVFGLVRVGAVRRVHRRGHVHAGRDGEHGLWQLRHPDANVLGGVQLGRVGRVHGDRRVRATRDTEPGVRQLRDANANVHQRLRVGRIRSVHGHGRVRADDDAELRDVRAANVHGGVHMGHVHGRGCVHAGGGVDERVRRVSEPHVHGGVRVAGLVQRVFGVFELFAVRLLVHGIASRNVGGLQFGLSRQLLQQQPGRVRAELWFDIL